MKSKVNIKSHPLHPILVSFPITFFTGAFVADAATLITHHTIYSRIAQHMEIAGIITALLAAAPGIIDYFKIVPPKSSAKKRATKHGLTNILMVVIFSLALYLRISTTTDLLYITITEGIGFALMLTAAWWGGTLIYRNQIGIDHRYAEAGKWKEETINTSEKRIELKGLGELKPNQMKLLHINGKRIVVARTNDGYAAFDDFCTHRGGSLADGAMICGTVQCPWHGSQFDVGTGQVKAGPAKQPIKIYALLNEGGKVLLQL
jgi:nitrite reductase/ring-hydroxylating ferredoxin subunit/uncharacterized membrane protein